MRKLAVLALLAACAHGPRAADAAGWIELRSEHFAVRTDLPESDARELVKDFERRRAVMLAVVWPGLSPPAGQQQVVALADEDDVHRYARPGIGGFVSFDPFGQRVVVVAGGGEGGRRVLNRELAHALADHYLVRQPRWLAEGLACYLETLRLDRERGVVGELDKNRLALVSHFSSAYRGGVLSTGAEYLDLPGEQLAAFESASWVLVHYLIDERRQQLNAYEARLARGEDPQAAFDAQFPDLSEDELQRAVRTYTHPQGTYPQFAVPLPQWEGSIAVEPLPPAEVHSLRASFSFQRAGDPAQRDVELGLALQADPLNPLALALGGAGDAAAAAKAHPGDWRAWFLLAERSGDAKALTRAAQLAPQNAQVLSELSRARGKEGRRDEALALAVQAATLEPGAARNLDALAWALAAKKRCKEALAAEARALEVFPEGAPPEMLARARSWSVELQSRCGVKPQRVDLLQAESESDTEPQRKSCGSAPRVTLPKGPLTAEYLVREDGSVAEVTLTGDASASVLRAFEQFVRSCRYQPATKDGRPVATRMRQDLSVAR